jgi:hypothetical protein
MDMTTKILLAAIAAGLWFNAAASLSIPATAQTPPTRQQTPRPPSPFHDADLNDIDRDLAAIHVTLSNLRLDFLSLAEGRCLNRKLCGP